MPTVRTPDAPPALDPPLCPACGKAMRLECSEPTTPYVNLDDFKFVCDCGETAHKLVANQN